MSALGLEEGVHQLGQLKIEIRSGRAYIAGTDTLCGSTAEMTKCVRHFKEVTGSLNIIYIYIIFVIWIFFYLN